MSDMRSVDARTVRASIERAAAVGSWTVTFASEAVPGTLAAFAGVLALSGLDISSAIVRKTPDGMVHDRFEIRSADLGFGSQRAEALAALAQDALSGRLDLRERMLRLRDREAPAFSTPPLIEVLDDSELTTGIRVRAADRPGLLFDIAIVLTDHGLRTRALTVLTFGGMAYDTFRVVTADGQPATVIAGEPDRLKCDLIAACS